MADGIIIHGGQLVRRWNRPDLPPIADGALYADGGRVAATGTLPELIARWPQARRIGGPHLVVIPGFVNAHSHGRGLTTWQMGQADEPLDIRLIEFLHRRSPGGGHDPDGRAPYLDTLYSCAKQLAAGVTTTFHNHGYVDGPVEAYEASTRPLLRAYRDSGLRCAFSLGVRDGNSYTFQPDAEFLAALPAAVRAQLAGTVPTVEMTVDAYVALFRRFAAAFPEIVLQLGPTVPAYCTDALLEAVADASRREGWRIQTHLNETMHQAAYARRRYGKSLIAWLDGIGMLSPRFSGAHGVWSDAADIEILARSGAQIVYNPGSNLRLQSGIAPIPALLAAGVKVAFGLDSLSLNDDDDMLQDLRFGRLVQGSWGIDGAAIPAETMLEMATATGALVAGIEGVGTLEVGAHADAVLVSLPDIEGAPGDHPVAESLLMRGRAAHVRSVVIGGTVMIEDGAWRGRTPEQILAELLAVSPPGRRATAGPAAAVKDAARTFVRNAER
jgi:cytosine/adenosine deaminase-related metal-dependent hydrolase